MDIWQNSIGNLMHVNFAHTGIVGSALKQEMRELYERANLETGTKLLQHAARLNTTEDRYVGHHYQRASAFTPCTDEELYPDLEKSNECIIARSRAVQFAKGIARSQYNRVVNIGIGGSFLGNQLLVKYARAAGHSLSMDCHFITGNDSEQWGDLIHKHDYDPSSTLFIVVSKSFGTQETLDALDMLQRFAGDFDEIDVVAVTNNIEAAKAVGIKETLWMPDYVGGRFSIWGPCSLAAMIVIGIQPFRDFIEGGVKADIHMFGQTAPEDSIPLALAAIDLHLQKTFNAVDRVIAPYAEGLRYLPTYVQQLEMESLGKPTSSHEHYGMKVWGEIGPDCQHSYFQMIHQGNNITPVEFVLLRSSKYSKQNLAALGQMKALTEGNGEDLIGNRPSSMITLAPSMEGLGALIATYEHKIFYMAQILGINAFDQPAVELGKRFMIQLLNNENIDPTTEALMKLI